MKDRRYVVEPALVPGGVPRVRVERVARWQFIGRVESEQTADEIRDEVMLGLRDDGVGPDPIVSYEDDGEGGRVLHLDWPDLVTHVLDPEFARVLALASLPLFRSCAELDDTPPTDRETLAAAERQVADDRAHWGKQRRERRARKRARAPEPERQPTQGPPKPSPEIFEVEMSAAGWQRSRPRPRLALRARWRR